MRGRFAIPLVLAVAACGGAGPPSPAGPSSSPLSGDRPRLVIDTDMAADDIVAIASLLRDPTVEVVAITVPGTGEAHCPQGADVARALVATLIEGPLPIACGRQEPLGPAQPFPDAWRAGVDAAYGLDLAEPGFDVDGRSAHELLVEISQPPTTDARPLTILTLGTLTNLAGAVELDPTLVTRVRVVSMLGAVEVPGNATPDGLPTSPPPPAEWNAHADPTAVARVLDAGFDLTLIPLDATNDLPLTGAFYETLAGDHVAGPADVVFELWEKNQFLVQGGLYFWDPLAAAAIRRPELVTTRGATVRVMEGDGLDGGQLLEAAEGAAVTIATSADRPAFEAYLLELLRVGGPRAG